jgi:hypothetical protein
VRHSGRAATLLLPNSSLALHFERLVGVKLAIDSNFAKVEQA